MSEDRFFEKCMIFFVLLLVVSFSYAVVETAEGSRHKVEIYQQKQEVKSLPEKCQPFYNDGTDQWKDCMGVGFK